MAFTAFLKGILGALWRERRFSAKQIRSYRDARLQAMVRHAYKNTTFWRERLDHIDLEQPINLAQIAPVTKTEFMRSVGATIVGGTLSRSEIESCAEDVSRVGRVFHRDLVLATTSGTTGQIGYFVKNARSLAEINGILMARILRDRLIPRELLRFSFGRRYRMAMTIATGGHFISHILGRYQPILSRAFADLRCFSIMERLDAVVCDLNRFRPHYLHGYPTFLEALAHEKFEGRLAIDPEFISLGSEPFSMSARRAIVGAFPRAQISETYGATECLAIANQCSAGHLHVNEDVVIVEPVDKTGRPVSVGVASHKVLITNLMNYAQPLLRYELTDSVTLVGDDCPCGSPMLRIKVEGRSDDTLFLEDDHGEMQAHPPMPFEALMLGVRGLKQFQLVHRAQNHIELRLVLHEATDRLNVEKGIEDRLLAFFRGRNISKNLVLKIEVVGEISRDPKSHKIRQIYSEV